METEQKTAQEIFEKMAAHCSRSEQCSTDIHKKITTAGLSSDEADEIIEKLKAEKFIDDERYVRSYVSDKFKFNKWGKVKIRHYLKMKGLSDELIQAGLNKIETDKYHETLIKTMKEKARKVKKKNKYEKMGQIIRFAQNRGFEPEMIHRYLNEVVD
ncbi:regulatory protein [Tangfeifania diversioriginum]|uniref:Regulatory protein RecX n=1 Tax=Tangfeifania diversioriginum TaxID=1168035 RepID=A0A1M6KFA0_9BACT|nr:regulatory protein RecX [Tangfeifania diversioriginum]SHJ57643.1 regulatory protein [Tangfeifania diversioriginum]